MIILWLLHANTGTPSTFASKIMNPISPISVLDIYGNCVDRNDSDKIWFVIITIIMISTERISSEIWIW